MHRIQKVCLQCSKGTEQALHHASVGSGLRECKDSLALAAVCVHAKSQNG